MLVTKFLRASSKHVVRLPLKYVGEVKRAARPDCSFKLRTLDMWRPDVMSRTLGGPKENSSERDIVIKVVSETI